MTIEHTSMLLRAFGSIREYSNQSIEAAHSLHRQLYSKASSHDRHGYTSSSKCMEFIGIYISMYSVHVVREFCFRCKCYNGDNGVTNNCTSD